MAIQRFLVKEVRREHPIAIVDPGDFELEASGEIDPQEVLANPAFGLYCFDPGRDLAWFVEVDDPAAVEAGAFYYQSQAEHAVGAAAMPMETFHALAVTIDRPPLGVALVHSVGRCGSTLLSKLLQTVPEIHSLSEPDDLTQLTFLRAEGEVGDAWVMRALQSSVRWRCKPRAGDPPSLVAIKTRSEVLALADLIGASFPDDKHLFLYRDGLAWMRTIFRTWPAEESVYEEERNREMQRRWGQILPALNSMPPLNAVEIRTMGWVVAMEGYLALRRAGLTTCAVRYEDLTSCPKEAFRRVLAYCGVEAVDWTAVEEVLGRDSQAGTFFDREERRKQNNQLTDELERDIRNLVASRPDLRSTDVVLPGTIGCA